MRHLVPALFVAVALTLASCSGVPQASVEATVTPVAIVDTATSKPTERSASPTQMPSPTYAPTPSLSVDLVEDYEQALRMYGSGAVASMTTLAQALQGMDITSVQWRNEARTLADSAVTDLRALVGLTPAPGKSSEHASVSQNLRICQSTLETFLSSLEAVEDGDPELGLEVLEATSEGWGQCGERMGELANKYGLEIPPELNATQPTGDAQGELAAATATPVPTNEIDGPNQSEAISLTAVATSNANIRSRPGTEKSVILGQIKVGDTLTLRMQTPDGQWFSAETSSGHIGWVDASLLEVDEMVASGVPLGSVDPSVPNVEPTQKPPAATPESVNRAMSDDEFVEYIQNVYGTLAGHELQLEDFTVIGLDEPDLPIIVVFDVGLDEEDYINHNISAEDLSGWAGALLRDLMFRWPGRGANVELAHTYYLDSYSGESDCTHISDNYSTVMDGWLHRRTIVEATYYETLQDKDIQVCGGMS